MYKRLMQGFILVILVNALGAMALGQQAAAQKEPEFVEHREFKTKLIELKYRDPVELVSVLSGLGSGSKGAKISYDRQYKGVTVRDFPENIATIEDALKRLDVPQPIKPAARDIEVTAYVLVASNQTAASGQYPVPLRDVLAQLQTTLGYKSYQLLTPIVQRTGSSASRIESNGVATMPDGTFSARYSLMAGMIEAESRAQPDSGGIVFHNVAFSLRGESDTDYKQIGDAKLNTKLTLKDGEKVVVGTASLKDKALILVLMAKWIN
jgi:hypothetical protein